MTDRERLTEILNKTFEEQYNKRMLITAQHTSDYLLDNGVIVPPCKVGDELFCVYSPPYPANPADKGIWFMGEFEVARFHYGVKGLSIEMYGYGTVNVNEIGKTVFLTREAAEKALAERSVSNV